jgi:hypothetical protein
LDKLSHHNMEIIQNGYLLNMLRLNLDLWIVIIVCIDLDSLYCYTLATLKMQV